MIRLILLKIRQRIIAYAKRFKRPISVEPNESFYANHFNGLIPKSDFFTKQRRPQFFFDPNDAINYKKIIKENFWQSINETCKKADTYLNHQFDLLGSGEVNLGKKINWHRDFKSGYCWANIPYARLAIINPHDQSDIKVVWELSRLQHLTTLGKAFWYTEDESYLNEFVETINDWSESNKVDYGPNWTCPMEVAIRAINIIWGLNFFSYKNKLEDEFIQNTIKLLYYHGQHIEENLEKIERGANTNHLLSDYLGLLYISILFPEFDRSERWKEIAISGLEDEISLEVFDDGADYECSTSYHRLVTEIFLSAYILAEKNNTEFSATYKSRLEKMINFSESITPQSGIVPFVGDNDDGFIVTLSHRNPASHAHIIEVGNKLFGNPLPYGQTESEESLYYLGIDAVLDKVEKRKLKSSLFKSSGYGIIRNDRMHLLFTASKIKDKNLAGHKHNDNLSFTLEIDSTRYFVDPGTFCYTSDYDERNRNRSVRNHNTVQIDSEEQNRFYTDKLFYMNDDSESEIDLWVNTSEKIIVSGTHKGYTKLKDNITHRRTIWTDLKRTIIKIVDEFDGSENSNEHLFESKFISPVETIKIQKDNSAILSDVNDQQLKLQFISNKEIDIQITPTSYFPNYGVAQPAQMITCKVKDNVPCKLVTLMEMQNNLNESRLYDTIVSDRSSDDSLQAAQEMIR